MKESLGLGIKHHEAQPTNAVFPRRVGPNKNRRAGPLCKHDLSVRYVVEESDKEPEREYERRSESVRGLRLFLALQDRLQRSTSDFAIGSSSSKVEFPAESGRCSGGKVSRLENMPARINKGIGRGVRLRQDVLTKSDAR